MFTGLIERVGRISERRMGGDAGKLTVCLERAFDGALAIGESIAVNGCCLSLEREAEAGKVLVFHTLAETLSRTNLGDLEYGAPVNLERAVGASGRMGGHFVTGHIDGTAKILSLQKHGGGDWELSVELDQACDAWIVAKGSVALDGVSLTVEKLEEKFFAVALIPLTLDGTALAERAARHDRINLEFDLLGKYVARQVELGRKAGESGSVTYRKLFDAGFMD
ncbi:MAG: riboflavin synthase [Victivallaceae bacterium]|nr:riboflavin synthase [Victivallaceae bacterium]